MFKCQFCIVSFNIFLILKATRALWNYKGPLTAPGAAPLGGINSRKKSKVSNIKLAVVRTERNVTFCGKEMISSSTLFLLQHSSETLLQHHVFAASQKAWKKTSINLWTILINCDLFSPKLRTNISYYYSVLITPVLISPHISLLLYCSNNPKNLINIQQTGDSTNKHYFILCCV